MTRGSIREYIVAVRGRCFLECKREKGKISDKFTKVIGCRRKETIQTPIFNAVEVGALAGVAITDAPSGKPSIFYLCLLTSSLSITPKSSLGLTISFLLLNRDMIS